MNYVKSFDLFGVPASQIPSITGSGAPTTATEGAVGCLYMDTDTGDLYKCTAVADGVYTWVEAGGSGGGISNVAKDLLITILRNGVYSTDQSANITALETALGATSGEVTPDEPEVPDEPVIITCTITSALVNVESSNTSAIVNEGSNYTATLTAIDGYEIESVIVTMGGVDITATAYADGVVSIASVTGDVVITASAAEINPGGIDWVSGAEVAYTLVDGEWAEDDGSFVPYDGYSRTDFIYCYGAGHIYHSCKGNVSINVVFYDISKNIIGTGDGYYAWTVIPENAAYVVMSFTTEAMTGSVIKLYKKVEPTWTDGEAYEFTFVENEYINAENGQPTAYNGWKRTDYVNCAGATKITKTNVSAVSQYGGFYNAEKEYLIGMRTPDTSSGTPADITVPVGACYFVTSDSNANMDALVLIPYA